MSTESVSKNLSDSVLTRIRQAITAGDTKIDSDLIDSLTSEILSALDLKGDLYSKLDSAPKDQVTDFIWSTLNRHAALEYGRMFFDVIDENGTQIVDDDRIVNDVRLLFASYPDQVESIIPKLLPIKHTFPEKSPLGSMSGNPAVTAPIYKAFVRRVAPYFIATDHTQNRHIALDSSPTQRVRQAVEMLYRVLLFGLTKKSEHSDALYSKLNNAWAEHLTSILKHTEDPTARLGATLNEMARLIDITAAHAAVAQGYTPEAVGTQLEEAKKYRQNIMALFGRNVPSPQLVTDVQHGLTSYLDSISSRLASEGLALGTDIFSNLKSLISKEIRGGHAREVMHTPAVAAEISNLKDSELLSDTEISGLASIVERASITRNKPLITDPEITAALDGLLSLGSISQENYDNIHELLVKFSDITGNYDTQAIFLKARILEAMGVLPSGYLTSAIDAHRAKQEASRTTLLWDDLDHQLNSIVSAAQRKPTATSSDKIKVGDTDVNLAPLHSLLGAATLTTIFSRKYDDPTSDANISALARALMPVVSQGVSAVDFAQHVVPYFDGDTAAINKLLDQLKPYADAYRDTIHRAVAEYTAHMTAGKPGETLAELTQYMLTAAAKNRPASETAEHVITHFEGDSESAVEFLQDKKFESIQAYASQVKDTLVSGKYGEHYRAQRVPSKDSRGISIDFNALRTQLESEDEAGQNDIRDYVLQIGGETLNKYLQQVEKLTAEAPGAIPVMPVSYARRFALEQLNTVLPPELASILYIGQLGDKSLLSELLTTSIPGNWEPIIGTPGVSAAELAAIALDSTLGAQEVIRRIPGYMAELFPTVLNSLGTPEAHKTKHHPFTITPNYIEGLPDAELLQFFNNVVAPTLSESEVEDLASKPAAQLRYLLADDLREERNKLIDPTRLLLPNPPFYQERAQRKETPMSEKADSQGRQQEAAVHTRFKKFDKTGGIWQADGKSISRKKQIEHALAGTPCSHYDVGQEVAVMISGSIHIAHVTAIPEQNKCTVTLSSGITSDFNDDEIMDIQFARTIGAL